MKIVAHRGSAKLAPENSLEAIKLSVEIGVSGIEIDIRLSKDKQLVVFHDPTLKRLGGTDQAISDLTLEEISRLTLKSGASIPTLKAAILASANTPLIIEGKDTGWAEYLNREILMHPQKNIRVISFNEAELVKFKKLNPEVESYIIKIFRGFKAINIAKKNDLDGIALFFLGLNPLTYYLAKKNNLKINVYTLNSLFLTRIFRRLYKNLEYTTDNPLKLKKLAADTK